GGVLNFNAEWMLELQFVNVIHNGPKIVYRRGFGFHRSWLEISTYRGASYSDARRSQNYFSGEYDKKKTLAEMDGIAIMEMANWMMSDTAPACRAVAKHFPELGQKDCAMHIMNLRFSYGLGVRDNTATTASKFRARDNYFSAGNRGSQLARVQSARSLPELAPIGYPETRVAVCCKLLRRSTINHNSAKTSNPFSCITTDEWHLVIEMEAVTNFTLTLRWSNFNANQSFLYFCLSQGEKPQTNPKLVRSDSPTHLALLVGSALLAVKSRFRVVSKTMILILLLDPRTKSIASEIAANMDEATSHSNKHLEDLAVAARSKLIKARYDALEKSWSRGSQVNELDVDWVQVSLQRLLPPETKESKTKTPEQVRLERKKLLTFSNGVETFRETCQDQFPSIAVLAIQRIGKVSSPVYQERVFSTAGVIMGPLQTRTDTARVKKQLLLDQNSTMLRGTDAEEILRATQTRE
ncbi:hypothetical protein GN958_ATG09248, partial [Phytophthora infestans]